MQASEQSLVVGTAPLDLSVVVPAFNEAVRLPRTLDSLQQFLDVWGLDYEVIVVDDGSQDGTAAIAETFGTRFSTVSLACNQGKGAAVRAGMLQASGEVIAFMDADLPYELKALCEAYDMIRSGQVEVVLGARDREGSGSVVKRRVSRSLASTVFRLLTRWLISRQITDTQAGLKCFQAAAAKRIFSLATVNSFAFDTEIVVLIHELQLSCICLPVTLINEDASSLSLRRHTMPMLLDMLQVRWNVWRGMYFEPPLVLSPNATTLADGVQTSSDTSKAAA